MSKEPIIAAAYPDQGVGSDPEPLGLPYHHQGLTFINAYIKLLQTWFNETEGKMGVMICLGHGGMRSLSASSS